MPTHNLPWYARMEPKSRESRIAEARSRRQNVQGLRRKPLARVPIDLRKLNKLNAEIMDEPDNSCWE